VTPKKMSIMFLYTLITPFVRSIS